MSDWRECECECELERIGGTVLGHADEAES